MQLDTKRIWAYDWRLQGERSREAIADRLIEYGIQGLEQEVRYQDRWQGDIDKLSPRSMQEVVDFASYLQGRGLYLTPVFVPGTYDDAEFDGQIIKEIGCGVIDLEWDTTSTQYWHDDPRGIAAYAMRLRELAPDALIGWQPDSRIASRGGDEWKYLAVEVVEGINFFEPQLYVGWDLYGTDMRTVQLDIDRFNTFASLGLPVYPTIYSAGVLSPVLGLLSAINPSGMCAFRLGATKIEGLSFLRDFQLRQVEPPAPPPPADKTYQDGRNEVANEVDGWLDDDVAEIEHRRDLRRGRLNEIRGGNS